jgi:hypothetical protein
MAQAVRIARSVRGSERQLLAYRAGGFRRCRVRSRIRSAPVGGCLAPCIGRAERCRPCRDGAEYILANVGPDLVLVSRIGEQLSHGNGEQKIGDKNSKEEQRKPPLTEDRPSGGFPVVKVRRDGRQATADASVIQCSARNARSLLNARASSWRILSRVTPMMRPVCSSDFPSPVRSP